MITRTHTHTYVSRLSCLALSRGLRVNCLVSWFGIGPPRSHLRSDEDRDNRDEVEEREEDRERERERECVCSLSEGRKEAGPEGRTTARTATKGEDTGVLVGTTVVL